MTAKSHILKKRFIKELTNKLGNVSAACKSLHPDDEQKAENLRRAYYDWMKKDKEFAESVNFISEKTTDFVESKLLSLVNELNVTAIIFYLKTRAKDRGYIERNEVDLNGNLDITVKPPDIDGN